MSAEPLLSLRGVSVEFFTSGRHTVAADAVSFDVHEGEVVAVVGESGSGKTVTAMSLLGLLPPAAVVTGSAKLRGRDLYTLPPHELRAVRGGQIGTIFQEPMNSLNPVFRIGALLAEAIRAHTKLSKKDTRARAAELLTTVEIREPQRILRSYPHELSGGQLQRVGIAMALAHRPALLIADEPTTALDVTVQAGILELLRRLSRDTGTAVLLITHDMGVVADLADRVVVMRDGSVVEQNDVTTLFAEPGAAYTRELLESVLSPDPAAPGVTAGETQSGRPLVEVGDLAVVYRGGYRQTSVRAVDGVSLSIRKGEVLGLVGESGSGKTTITGALTGLVPITGGSVVVDGVDMTAVRGKALKAVRSRIGVVFQDPAGSLNPRATVGASITEPLLLHGSKTGHRDRIGELMESVRLDRALADRYPHELSGGQRQRVSLARALALNPVLLIADEPTSALDVSVQATILALFARLRTEFSFACLFVSHDLAVIQQVADRVVVLRDGKIVEEGSTGAVLGRPREDYTRRLIAAAPVADPAAQAERRARWLELTR